MPASQLMLVLIIFSVVAFFVSRYRSVAVAKPLGGIRYLHSLPFYYALRAALWCFIPAAIVFGVWSMFSDSLVKVMVLDSLPVEEQPTSAAAKDLLLNKIQNVAKGSLSADRVSQQVVTAAERFNNLENTSLMAKSVLVLILAIMGGIWGWVKIAPQVRARQQVESILRTLLLCCASIAILTTVGIVFSVLFESVRFFGKIPATDFLFGLSWSPQTALRADQVASEGAFGAIPLLLGTLLISLIALLVAVPIGLMAAIYLSEYASSRVRSVIKPMLEILAGIPTVVYGFFAALTVAPMVRGFGESIGLDVSSESALAAGLVMGVMIIPFVSSLADDVITAVPRAMRDASLGLGATQSETIKRVIFPAALPGIMGGILLAASRAIGETMVVVMAAGLAANLTINPLEAVTTVTVQIVTLLTGDQEFDSAKTLAAFALGLLLFVITLLMNVWALHIVKKYREQYD